MGEPPCCQEGQRGAGGMGAVIFGFYSLAFGAVRQLHISALCQETQGTSSKGEDERYKAKQTA